MTTVQSAPVGAWGVRRVPSVPAVDPTPTGVFVVTEPDGTEVVVRLRPDRDERWRCASCETRTTTADCMHTYTVGVHLAETVLGLTRVPTQGATDV